MEWACHAKPSRDGIIIIIIIIIIITLRIFTTKVENNKKINKNNNNNVRISIAPQVETSEVVTMLHNSIIGES